MTYRLKERNVNHAISGTQVDKNGEKPNELLIAVAVASGGRVHERVGGVRVDEIQGDGLR